MNGPRAQSLGVRITESGVYPFAGLNIVGDSTMFRQPKDWMWA